MVRFVGWGAGPDSSYATRTANLGTAQNTAERWNKFNNRMNLMSQLTSDVGNLIEAPGSERYAAKVAADKEARRANMETVDAYGGAYDRADKVVTGLQSQINTLVGEQAPVPKELEDKLAQAESLRDQYGANYQTALASIGILGGDTADEKRNKIASGDQADTSTVTGGQTPVPSVDRGNVVDRMLSNLVDKRGSVPTTSTVTEVVGTQDLKQEAVNLNAEDVDSSFGDELIGDAINAYKDMRVGIAPYMDKLVSTGADIYEKATPFLDATRPTSAQVVDAVMNTATGRPVEVAAALAGRQTLDAAGSAPQDPTSPQVRDTRRSALPPIGEVATQVRQQALDLGSSVAEKVSGAWQDITAPDTWKNILKEPTIVGKGPGASEKAKEVSVEFMKNLPANVSDMGTNFLNRIDTFGDSILKTDYGRANQEEVITLKEVAVANLVGTLSAIPAGRILLKAKTAKKFNEASKDPNVRKAVQQYIKDIQIKSIQKAGTRQSKIISGPPKVNPNAGPPKTQRFQEKMKNLTRQRDILEILDSPKPTSVRVRRSGIGIGGQQ